MSDIIHNLISFNGSEFKDALRLVRSESSVFDFNLILPVPSEFNVLTAESLFFMAFAGHIKGLNLGDKKTEKLLMPIIDLVDLDKLDSLYEEHKKVLKFRYDSNGNHRQPDIYKGMPLSVQDYIRSGEIAYNCLLKYGVITGLAWKAKNWGCATYPSNIEFGDNQIYFETSKRIPIMVLEKWCKDNGLTMTLKSLHESLNLWSVNEYKQGMLSAHRMLDDGDRESLIDAFYQMGKIEQHDLSAVVV